NGKQRRANGRLFTRSAIFQKIDFLHEDRPGWNGIPETVRGACLPQAQWASARLSPRGRRFSGKPRSIIVNVVSGLDPGTWSGTGSNRYARDLRLDPWTPGSFGLVRFGLVGNSRFEIRHGILGFSAPSG